MTHIQPQIRNILTKGGALALVLAATSVSAIEVHTFGSDNGGLAGFTPSTPPDATEIWTTQAGSVQYRNEATGTRNASLLRSFPLDRSVGKSYRMEGVVTLTEGYVDDNNRVGLYLFGDAAVVPNENEIGALGLIFNSDDGSLNSAPTGNNSSDDLTLRQGIDSTPAYANELRNQTTTTYSQDLFGTMITFTVDINFTNDGLTDNIEIDATMTDSSGDKTKVSAVVPAADYTGDYFGFVTRSRSRFYGDANPPSPEGRNLPWVMDYVSFSFTKLSLSIEPNVVTPGSFDFSWGSKDGKLYDLVSDTVLSNPISNWPVWEGNSEIPASGAGINTLTAVPGGGDPRRFFAVVEKDPPPLFEEFFDAAGPGLPVGWVAANATTVWEVGDPSSLPNLQNPDGTNCAGTNVVAGAYADEVATVTLTSPAIPIPAGGATLSFRQYIDCDALNGDVGAIRLLDASDTEIVEGAFPVTGIDGVETGWTEESFALPPSAAGQNVKVVFEFSTAVDGMVYNGFYVDDVQINAN